MSEAPGSSPEPAVAPDLIRARNALQGGRLDEAVEASRSALSAPTSSDDRRDAFYVQAVALRYLKRLDDAQTTLDTLKTEFPTFARGFQERGHLSSARSLSTPAREAYQKAVILNPALTASWKALDRLYTEAGQAEAAERARAQAARLEALPPELVSVTSFLHEDRISKAERLCRAFLKRQPHHPEAMRLLAKIGVRLNVLDDAEFLLESCLAFDEGDILARIDYVDVLQRRQKYAEALEQARLLTVRDPANPAYLNLVANAAMAVGRYDEALKTFTRILPQAEDPAPIHLSIGHARKTIGDQDQAVTAYRAAYAARPAFGDAFWSLANLKTYRFTDDELTLMARDVEAVGTSVTDRTHLCFALAKALEDRGDTDRAFALYDQGNALKHAQVRYDPDRMDRDFAAQMHHGTSALFETQGEAGHSGTDPIFIVGLPRAGSTLVEQILASHSQVDGTLELPNILALAHRLDGRRNTSEDARYPGVLHALTREQRYDLGAAYLADTRIHRQGAPYFTDKMPNNFRHIGLIHLILPNAKIIDARRDPMACGFSCYKQLFAEGQEFTYSLTDIAQYYRGYEALMAHWDTVLPGKVLRVQHEDVVHDLETQVRRILDFCGLPFEDACVAFHKTKRAVRTASSEQVRRPVSAEGLDQWRRFEAHLDPLKTALQTAQKAWAPGQASKAPSRVPGG